MKKVNRMFLWTFLMVLMVGFAACSNDDDNGFDIDESQLVGSWTYSDTHETSEIREIQEFQFNADGTFTHIEKNNKTYGNWDIIREVSGTYKLEWPKTPEGYPQYLILRLFTQSDPDGHSSSSVYNIYKLTANELGMICLDAPSTKLLFPRN